MPLIVTERTGLNIFYREAGSGHPVLLLHGMGLDHRSWGQQASILKENFRMISIDARDGGQSDEASASYGTSDMADDAVGLMDALGIDKAHVVGYSMGGMVAQQLALNHPERVNRLVRTSTFQWLNERDRAAMYNRKAMKQYLPHDEFTRYIFLEGYSWQEYAISGLVESMLNRALSNPPTQIGPAYDRLADAILSHDTRNQLQDIQARTLILVGDEDIDTPKHYAEEMAKAIPGARLISVPETGHAFLFARGKESTELIRAFLSEES